MFIKKKILDDVLLELYPLLLSKTDLVSTSRGEVTEILGLLIEIEDPRARLSRTETRGKPFSCLGELLWYLSRENDLDFIKYYIEKYVEESDDGLTVRGGYGRRMFNQRGNNQVAQVIELLKERPHSRRAVIQLFDAEDTGQHFREVPCTTALQFLIREDKLHLFTSMRSNDAFIGLPHDVFCFTMIQEIFARSLGCEIGSYKHFVGNMHLYERDREKTEQYIGEAVQRTVSMPDMPSGDPWGAISSLLDAERQIRRGDSVDADQWELHPYWADLIRLLQIFQASGDNEKIETLKLAMSSERFEPYIDSRKRMGPRRPSPPIQETLKL